MLPDPREQPLLTVVEFCRASSGRVRRSAAYEAVRRGEIPSVRIGRKRFVPTAAAWRLFGLDPPQGNGAPAGAPPTRLHVTLPTPAAESEARRGQCTSASRP